MIKVAIHIWYQGPPYDIILAQWCQNPAIKHIAFCITTYPRNITLLSVQKTKLLIMY
jgi:hypothetical protein